MTTTTPCAGTPMSYGDYTLDAALQMFQLSVTQVPLFGDVRPVEPSAWRVETLRKGKTLALFSEKSRSEFIVAPMLLTCRDLAGDACFVYSGVRLDVDTERGLCGECDFILARTAPSPALRAPLLVVVEAKKNDIEEGLGQCVAQMVGARLFNERHGQQSERVYGCVTTGESWQFLRLEDATLAADTDRYYISEPGKILAVLLEIMRVTV